MLYIVSTPIGNLKDISQRALDTLGSVDAVAMESPTDSLRLLHAYGISGKKVVKYNDRNKKEVEKRMCELLVQGDVAYISSAGTPGISDPGQDLVALARSLGVEVRIVPGPSALVSAIVASGFRARQFTFVSFPPKRSGQLKKLFQEFLSREELLVFFESPYRIIKTLETLEGIAPQCKVCVAKEITKLFENYFIGDPDNVIEQLQKDAKQLRGEFVVVVDFSGN